MTPPCAGSPDLFFSTLLVEQEAAKRVCLECPFRAKCLQRAFDLNSDHGIWGGYDEVERKFYRRIYGTTIRGRVEPLPSSLVAKLRRNKVVQTELPADEAMQA